MARHQQRPEKSLMQCAKCKLGDCTRCVDVTRSRYSDIAICSCERKAHGDPINSTPVDRKTEEVSGAVSQYENEEDLIT